MQSFGSPSKNTRAPPLIHFLIDLEESSISHIEYSISKTLLYYFYYVDNRLTWTFSFFHSKHLLPSIYHHSKIPSEFNADSLLKLHSSLLEFHSRNSSCNFTNTMDSSPFKTLIQAIQIVLQDMKWDWNSSCARMSGALLSPVHKKRVYSDPSLSHYSIRNCIYVISNTPNALTNGLSNASSNSLHELEEYVNLNCHFEEFASHISYSLHEGLSQLLMDTRCCLCFIDLNPTPSLDVTMVCI